MIIFLSLILFPLNDLYEEGKYFAVIDQAEQALKDTSLSVQERVRLHTILAFSYIALEKERLAKLEFLEALTLNPKLELDPVLTPPKIIQNFQEAKRTFYFFPKEGEVTLPLQKKDFLSLTIPGVWDVRSGNKMRGNLLLGGSSLSVLFLGVSHYQCEKYHRTYLDARNPNTIEDKYGQYSFWYQARTCFLASTTLIYLIHLFLLAK